MNTPPAPPPVVAASPVSSPQIVRQVDTDIATLLDEPAPRSWWLRWPFLLGFVAVVACVLGAYFWHAHTINAAAPVYSTAAVARGNLTLTVTANGTIQPTRSINIGSELSGTVLKVNVDVNDRIKKGQVFVVLDTAKLRDQILRSQAAVTSANGKVAQTAATFKEAQALTQYFARVLISAHGYCALDKAILVFGQVDVACWHVRLPQSRILLALAILANPKY